MTPTPAALAPLLDAMLRRVRSDEDLRVFERAVDDARVLAYDERRRRIVAALHDGASPTQIAREWGITRGRVYQMRDQIGRNA